MHNGTPSHKCIVMYFPVLFLTIVFYCYVNSLLGSSDRRACRGIVVLRIPITRARSMGRCATAETNSVLSMEFLRSTSACFFKNYYYCYVQLCCQCELGIEPFEERVM
uniref:Uncharacterized protein n=1 Tax=Rhipicephalus zambeziensis TaxID=60191 RepID=A0A224YLP1_9ACAR